MWIMPFGLEGFHDWVISEKTFMLIYMSYIIMLNYFSQFFINICASPIYDDAVV